MKSIGIDVGTRFIKMCVVEQEKLVANAIGKIGCDPRATISRLLIEMSADIDDGSLSSPRIFSTGHGARLVQSAHKKINQNVCLAQAVHHASPDIRTIIDVGGIFLNIIEIDGQGKIHASADVEKCAMGSGRFVETVAQALEIPFSQVSDCVVTATHPVSISSGCSVFAESEVITKINAGANPADILAGVLKSIAAKVGSMVKGAQCKDGLTLVGGLSQIIAFRELLQLEVGKKFLILPVDPQLAGAFGAALAAGELS